MASNVKSPVIEKTRHIVPENKNASRVTIATLENMIVNWLSSQDEKATSSQIANGVKRDYPRRQWARLSATHPYLTRALRELYYRGSIERERESHIHPYRYFIQGALPHPARPYTTGQAIMVMFHCDCKKNNHKRGRYDDVLKVYWLRCALCGVRYELPLDKCATIEYNVKE